MWLQGMLVEWARRPCVFGAAMLSASLVCAQTGPAGHWEGTLEGDGGRDVTVSLDLARDARSRWVASMGVAPDTKGLVVTDVTVDGSSVRFTAVELMMTRFDLTLGANGTLKGTRSTPTGAQPVEFKRTGEAKVELIPPSPAVSKELEGDWEGLLQTPARAFRVIFHFSNQADGTVLATIDTPDTQAMGLPLDNVKQTGRKVEWGMKIAHATFRGTLNAEGTELAGEFAHESNGVPRTLRKK
jgi:hypothetical protein